MLSVPLLGLGGVVSPLFGLGWVGGSLFSVGGLLAFWGMGAYPVSFRVGIFHNKKSRLLNMSVQCFKRSQDPRWVRSTLDYVMAN